MSAPAQTGGPKKLSRSKHGTLHELNITPLLDLVMVLLVIFMITTPQLSNDITLNLPANTQTRPQNPPKVTYIYIERTGSLLWGDTPVTKAEIPARVAALKKERPDPPVAIRGDPSVDYEKVIAVMDLLQDNGIEKVALDTSR